MRGIRHRIYQILLAVDQLINALFLNGWADETVSARAYRMQDTSKYWAIARKVIDTVLFFDKDHCKEAYYNEKMRTHLPPSLRDEDPRIQ